MILVKISLILWILILVYNAVYSLLPSDIQGIKWVKVVAIAVAIIILIGGIVQEVKKYHNFRFAYISSKDGIILKKKNFPWSVKRSKRGGNVVYVIYDRYGDASEVTVKPEKPVKYNVDMTMTGVGIEFLCPVTDIPNFTIKISN